MSLRDWTKQSGAFKIGELTTNDSVLRHLTTGTKYLECVTAGSVAIPSTQAYGTWEFDIYKGADSNTYKMQFISSNIATFPNAVNIYSLQINSNEGLYLYSATGASVVNLLNTAANYITNNIWYRIKITRTLEGVYTFLIKGGALVPTAGYDGWTLVSTTGGTGTNPITHNTYTTSNYMVLDLDAGDKIANIKFYDGVRQ